MAEVVKVPVVGKVPKPWIYAGGAAVAGIAGYAWWTRGALVEDTTTAVELPATDFEPPTVLDSGISVGGVPQGEPIARTNIEWVQMAREQAAGFGASDALTNSALTKYLGKDRLTVAEVALVSAIVSVLGQPPTGGPYSILPAPVLPPPPHVPPPPPQPQPKPSPVVRPTAPTRVIAKPIGGGRVAISWAGATGGPGSYYEIRSRGIVGIWKRVNGTSYTSGPWPRRAKLSFEVRTRNRLGVSPGRVSNPVIII